MALVDVDAVRAAHLQPPCRTGGGFASSHTTDRDYRPPIGSNGLPASGVTVMANHGGRRSRRSPPHLQESIAVYLKMQESEPEEEFQTLLAEHDRLTDADGLPRLVPRTLETFRRLTLLG
jgi:hypothetical protein